MAMGFLLFPPRNMGIHDVESLVRYGRREEGREVEKRKGKRKKEKEKRGAGGGIGGGKRERERERETTEGGRV